MERQPVPVERRQNLGLRAIFDDAYQRIEPFLDTARCWGGSPMTSLAYHAVRNTYPDLSPAEAYTLVAAAVRVYDTGGNRPPASAANPACNQPGGVPVDF